MINFSEKYVRNKVVGLNKMYLIDKGLTLDGILNIIKIKLNFLNGVMLLLFVYIYIVFL